MEKYNELAKMCTSPVNLFSPEKLPKEEYQMPEITIENAKSFLSDSYEFHPSVRGMLNNVRNLTEKDESIVLGYAVGIYEKTRQWFNDIDDMASSKMMNCNPGAKVDEVLDDMVSRVCDSYMHLLVYSLHKYTTAILPKSREKVIEKTSGSITHAVGIIAVPIKESGGHNYTLNLPMQCVDHKSFIKFETGKTGNTFPEGRDLIRPPKFTEVVAFVLSMISLSKM